MKTYINPILFAALVSNISLSDASQLTDGDAPAVPVAAPAPVATAPVSDVTDAAVAPSVTADSTDVIDKVVDTAQDAQKDGGWYNFFKTYLDRVLQAEYKKITAQYPNYVSTINFVIELVEKNPTYINTYNQLNSEAQTDGAKLDDEQAKLVKQLNTDIDVLNANPLLAQAVLRLLQRGADRNPAVNGWDTVYDYVDAHVKVS